MFISIVKPCLLGNCLDVINSLMGVSGKSMIIA